MPRPPKFRTIEGGPRSTFFKPRGIPSRLLETVVLGLDELEAIRLADLEGLYQEEAAARMNISRPTFGRLVAQARKKVADALFHGKALVFEGGAVCVNQAAWPRCGRCGQRWKPPSQSDLPQPCTTCGAEQRDASTEGNQPARHRGRKGRGRGGPPQA